MNTGTTQPRAWARLTPFLREPNPASPLRFRPSPMCHILITLRGTAPRTAMLFLTRYLLVRKSGVCPLCKGTSTNMHRRKGTVLSFRHNCHCHRAPVACPARLRIPLAAPSGCGVAVAPVSPPSWPGCSYGTRNRDRLPSLPTTCPRGPRPGPDLSLHHHGTSPPLPICNTKHYLYLPLDASPGRDHEQYARGACPTPVYYHAVQYLCRPPTLPYTLLPALPYHHVTSSPALPTPAVRPLARNLQPLACPSPVPGTACRGPL